MKTFELIDDQTYGHDKQAINKHRARTYRDESGQLYQLSRTLDGSPPFFEAYGPYAPDFRGLLPRLKIDGAECWGAGISWKRATLRFFATIGGAR